MQKNKFLIWISLIILTFSANAQTTEQMRKMAFNGVEVDFTGPTVTSQPISTPISTADGVYASYYNENDDLIVRVVDNTVYDENNNIVDQLFDQPTTGYKLTNQMVISPKDHDSRCEFNIFYVVITNDNQASLRYATYNRYLKEIVDEVEIHNYNYSGNYYANWTFTLSDFIGNTNEQRLYLVKTRCEDGRNSGDSIQMLYFKGPRFRMTDVILYQVGDNIPDVGELELSSDLSFIAYTNIQEVIVWELIPTTGFFTVYNDGYTNSTTGSRFVGLEISDDNNFMYVSNNAGSIHKFEMTNPPYFQHYASFNLLPTYTDYANSQIERIDDKYYLIRSDGWLGRINSTFTGIENVVNIGSSAVINNAICENSPAQSFDMYLIPDQMDGSEYNYTTGNDAYCCYDYETTPANANMTGVQIQTSGDDRDIIIQSGNSVTWTATSNSFGNVAEVFMEKGDIIIQPGASLTIEDMIIHFREGYEIQMDDNPSGVGSRLTLDNTTLTVFDECEGDKFWAGIDLSGGWDGQLQIPFSSCKQPYLKMLNNSKIEFAVRGVDAAAGGLVRAYDSDFINNIVSVTITGYTDQHSHFQNCDFIWDDEIYAKNENPSIHLHMWTASGVGVKGCRFKNEASLSESYPNRGVGIIADYTDFDLDGLCLDSPSQLPCINYQNNLFSRLYFGIKSNSGDNILVDRCDFTDNQRGAWIVSSSALQFTRNDLDVFDTQGGSFQINNSFGLYLESCTGYQVEENTFRDGRLGMVINSSGADENEIYYNDFYNLSGGTSPSVSAVTMGKNAETHTGNRYTGLQYKCNDFDQTDYAITLTGGIINTQSGNFIISNTMMRLSQGDDNAPADNTFWLHGEPMSTEADYYVDNTFADYEYKYYGSTDNSSVFDAVLNSYDAGNVLTSNQTVFTTRAQECPSNLSSGGVIIIPTLSTLNNKEAEQDSLESEYNALIADVNELELVIAAQTASEVNQQAVHNSLMEASPNLTDTVLSTYLLNDNANELSRTSVMIANSPLPGSVKEDVEISNLSPELKNHISQYQTGINHLEDLENKIQKTKASRQYLTDRLQLQYVHNESKETQLDWINYLENKTDLHSKLKLADMYIKQNQMSEAETLLANIETMLTGTENTEKLKQVKVKQIELALRQDMSCQELPSGDLAYLYELAEDYNHKSGGDARAILMASGIESFEPIVILPNPNQAKSAIADNSHENVERPSTTPKLQSRFEIFPNPVDDKLSVEFISMGETCDFVVYDMQGKIVKQLTRNEGLGYFVLDVTDLQSGNYILYSPQLSGKKQFVVKR